MKRVFLLLVLIGLALLFAWQCTFVVYENETAIVTRFGKPLRTLDDPGLYLKLPDFVDSKVAIDRRVYLLDPNPAEYLTSDKKNVSVDCFLAWRVADPLKFWTSVSSQFGAEGRLTDVLQSVSLDVIGSHPFSALVSHEEQESDIRSIADAITKAAAATARRDFGIEVVTARIKRLSFPQQNKDAVFRRMEQERESIAMAIRSEGSAAYDQIKAEADREEARLLSEAARKSAEMRGEADAEAVRIEADAYGKDPDLFRMKRELEVLQKALQEDSILILPADHPLLRVLNAGAPKPVETDDDHD